MAPPSQEAESDGLENLSEKEENLTSTSIAVGLGDSERLADQFLTLGLPLESEVCKKVFEIIRSNYQR